MGDGLFSLLAHGRCGKFEVSVYWFHDLFYDIYIAIIVCAFSDNWICPGCSWTARELWALFKFGESFRNPCFYNLQWKNCLGMATVLPFIQWDQTFGMYYKSKQQITWTYPWLRGLVKINTTILIVFCLFGFIFQAWDLGFGFDMNILYKTGWFVFISSMGAAAALAYFLWIKLEFCDLTKYRETEEF